MLPEGQMEGRLDSIALRGGWSSLLQGGPETQLTRPSGHIGLAPQCPAVMTEVLPRALS